MRRPTHRDPIRDRPRARQGQRPARGRRRPPRRLPRPGQRLPRRRALRRGHRDPRRRAADHRRRRRTPTRSRWTTPTSPPARRLALAERHGVEPDVHLHIVKDIPVAGGMAGGSADAAGRAAGLRRAVGHRRHPQELLDICAELGSDVPFSLVGGAALGRGRGELLTPLQVGGTFHWVFAVADGGLSTPAVYRECDRLRGAAGRRPAQAGSHHSDDPLPGLRRSRPRRCSPRCGPATRPRSRPLSTTTCSPPRSRCARPSPTPCAPARTPARSPRSSPAPVRPVLPGQGRGVGRRRRRGPAGLRHLPFGRIATSPAPGATLLS